MQHGEIMIRIANGQGFWGTGWKRRSVWSQGPLDYLALDYLAEVTMSILQSRSRPTEPGYARDFRR